MAKARSLGGGIGMVYRWFSGSCQDMNIAIETQLGFEGSCYCFEDLHGLNGSEWYVF